MRDTRKRERRHAYVYSASRDNEGNTFGFAEKQNTHAINLVLQHSRAPPMQRATHLQDRGIRAMTFTQYFANYFRTCESVSEINRAPIQATEDVLRLENYRSIVILSPTYIYRQRNV